MPSHPSPTCARVAKAVSDSAGGNGGDTGAESMAPGSAATRLKPGNAWNHGSSMVFCRFVWRYLKTALSRGKQWFWISTWFQDSLKVKPGKQLILRHCFMSGSSKFMMWESRLVMPIYNVNWINSRLPFKSNQLSAQSFFWVRHRQVAPFKDCLIGNASIYKYQVLSTPTYRS